MLLVVLIQYFIYFFAASFKEEENSAFETQPFPSLQRVSEYGARRLGKNLWFTFSFAHIARGTDFWV